MATPDYPAPARSLAARSRWIRYPLALILLLGSLAAVYFGWLRERTIVDERVLDVSADTEIVTTTTTSIDPTLTSASTLLLVLLIAALLWPDLTELNVFGVGLKRKIETVAQEAAGAKAESAQLRQTVNELKVEILRVETRSLAASHSESRAEAKVEFVSRSLNDLVGGDVPAATALDTGLVSQVITKWTELSGRLHLNDNLVVKLEVRTEPQYQGPYKARRRFVTEHFDELATAQALWQLAASSPNGLTLEDLRKGVALLDRLLQAADDVRPSIK